MFDLSKYLGRSAFLISKPLQLIVALCIAKQEFFEYKPIFIIVDAFSGAQDVANQLSIEFTELQTPKYFLSRKSSLAFIKKQKINNLFIDSDVGLKNFLMLSLLKFCNPKITTNVYEEGVGTYRTNLYSGFKKVFFNLIGIGSFFGGCCFVEKIYIFDEKKYTDRIPGNKFKVKKIQSSLLEFMRENRDSFMRLFDFHGVQPSLLGNSFCSLYLSGWKVDSDFLRKFKKFEGDLFVKIHPHVLDKLALDGVQYIDAKVPAELAIMDLIEKYQLVYIYDHNSSVRCYVEGENLIFNLVS